MMDCRTCEPTLIDLVHSELATDAAREAHAHLATCASCKASFETLVSAMRLAAQLPLVEPPAHVATRVMQLAEEHAREAAARKRVAAQRPTPWQALLDFVGRLATRPQVAMATIMVLIVAVGFWSLPRLRREPAVAGVVVNPEPDGEAAPGTGVEPAERLDLKVDMRAGRIRSKDGMPVPSAAPSAVVAESEPTPSAADEALAQRAKSAEDPFATLDDVDLGEGARAGERRVGESKGASASASARPAKPTSAAPSMGGGREFAKSPPLAAPAPAQPAADLRKAAPSTPARAAASPKRDSDSLSGYAQNERLNREGDRASAAEPPADKKRKEAPAPPASASAAPAGAAASQSATKSLAERLIAARDLGRRSGCAVALPDYQRIVLQAPSSAEAGSALIEMAQCRRNAGDIDVARSLLERAALIPEVAARARALIASLPGKGAK